MAVAFEDVGEHFRGEEFFLPPDHDVLERVIDVVIAGETLVDALGVVEERDVKIGVEGFDLVVIERGKEAMPPAEGGMRVDQHMLVLVGDLENLFEDRPAKRVEPADRKVENPPLRNIGCFLVHHLADVNDFQIDAIFVSELLNRFEVGPLIHANLAGDDCAHLHGMGVSPMFLLYEMHGREAHATLNSIKNDRAKRKRKGGA